MNNYFNLRMNDASPYYAIGNRLDINNYIDEGLNKTFYRGDCFICDYTHRMNRNFVDPEMGYTDKMVNPDANLVGTPDNSNNIDRGD